MNYTEDQITKAIAPYVSQKIINKYNPVHDDQVLDRNTIGAFLWFDGKLILKPLASISEDDADILALLAIDVNPNGVHDYWSEITFRSDRQILLRAHPMGEEVVINLDTNEVYLNVKENPQPPFNQALIIDFLRSKGYDLPSYHLGGKTLIEAGLAIDSTVNEKEEEK